MASSKGKEKEMELLRKTVAKLRAGIMAVVFGLVGGIGIFLATVWLLIRNGENVGSHLTLLNNYLLGYSVSWIGSIIGFFWGFLIGAVTGWLIAWIYNFVAGRRELAGRL
jgi:hypothetical protein